MREVNALYAVFIEKKKYLEFSNQIRSLRKIFQFWNKVVMTYVCIYFRLSRFILHKTFFQTLRKKSVMYEGKDQQKFSKILYFLQNSQNFNIAVLDIVK